MGQIECFFLFKALNPELPTSHPKGNNFSSFFHSATPGMFNIGPKPRAGRIFSEVKCDIKYSTHALIGVREKFNEYPPHGPDVRRAGFLNRTCTRVVGKKVAKGGRGPDTALIKYLRNGGTNGKTCRILFAAGSCVCGSVVCVCVLAGFNPIRFGVAVWCGTDFVVAT